MRLIDADKIPYTMLYKENWMTGTGKEAQGVWKSDIDKMPTVVDINNFNDLIRKQDAIEAAKKLLKYHGEKGLTDEFINYVSTNAMERIDCYGQKGDILQRDEMS